MERECRRNLLAQGGPFRIESCECGAVHISFGPVTFRATEEVVFDFFCALATAVRRLYSDHSDRVMNRAVAAFINGAKDGGVA